MRSLLIATLILTFTSLTCAQANFELQTPCSPFPYPLGTPGDPEGISWNGSPGLIRATVATLPMCGFPVLGSQYAWISAGGPVAVPPGGPLLRPASNPACEVQIPIPNGATSVSFHWEFFAAETSMNAAFNDGTSIAVVDASGNLIVSLVYADMFTPRGTCPAVSTCATGSGTEMAPAGTQFVFAALPPLPAGAYLSAVVWNGGDDAGMSALALDNVFFNGVSGPAIKATENCAVSVVSFAHMGTCPSNTNLDPSRALDLPASNGFFSLCDNDVVTFELGVAVADLAPGPDLQIEEVNTNIIECYRIQVSTNGSTWHEIPGPYPSCTGGPGVWAGDSAIDIGGIIIPPATVRFVRLIGASGSTGGSSPGPDIDSIVAINYTLPNFGGRQPAYAGTLIEYDQGLTTSASMTDGTQALGKPNAYRSETWNAGTGWQSSYHNFVSLGAGASLVVSFKKYWISDGPGADLVIHEYFSPEGQYTVEVSDDAFHWYPATPLGSVSPTHGSGASQTDNMLAFDLAGTGLALADYVRLVSTSTVSAGGTPGPEIDAVEAVHRAVKDRSLVGGPYFVQGSLGILNLSTHPGHQGDIAFTLPCVTPPSAPGSGIPLNGMTEWRLPLTDPTLSFVLYDPAAAIFFSGTNAVVPPGLVVPVTLSLPPAPPSLAGLELYWQSVLFTTSGAIVASNILRTTVQ